MVNIIDLDIIPPYCLDLFVCLLFYVPLTNFSLNRDITDAGEGLQNLGLCLALTAFEQG
jgi:hypothetical protein